MSYFACFWVTLSYPALYSASLHPFFELRCILWVTMHHLSYAVPHWAPFHSIELCCPLLSYTTPYRATLHSTELHFILLSYPICTLHPTELCCILLSYHTCTLQRTELCCTLLNYDASSEQRCTFLSHGTLYWVTLHPIELRCTYWAALHPIELRCTLLNYAVPHMG